MTNADFAIKPVTGNMFIYSGKMIVHNFVEISDLQGEDIDLRVTIHRHLLLAQRAQTGIEGNM